MQERSGAICIFVKAPQPGRVKTRLAPAIGHDCAAALARAFFADTLATACSLGWARVIVAADGDPNAEDSLAPAIEVWPQGEGDLGERIERVLARALVESPFAIALGTDAPELSRRVLEDARAALGRREAVIGPCDDGGFYLLGLRRCPPGLLRDLPWSDSSTLARTIERLERRGLPPLVLETLFDVDRPEDLDRLRGLLDRGSIAAPETRRVLGGLAIRPASRSGSAP